MGEKKITIKKTVDIDQVATFLRLLADELEGKSVSEFSEFGYQLHDFNKLKVALIRQEGGQLALSLKVKGSGHGAPSPAPDFNDAAESDYLSLKQQLKVTFVELNGCASQNILPSAEVLGRFMKQSHRVISFPGCGDYYYNDYWQACLAMEQAVDNGSAADFQEKMAAINTIKKACHRRFK